MKPHRDIETLLAEAHTQQRCAIISRKIRSAVSRRVAINELIQPARRMFIDLSYWLTLNSYEQASHIIRAQKQLNERTVFAGPTAALIFGWDVLNTVIDRGVYVGGRWTSRNIQSAVRTLATDSSTAVRTRQTYVTNIVQTLVDCASLLSFEEALSIFDSAARNGVDLSTIIAQSDVMKRLIQYADASSENAGESFARGVMIAEGFVPPRLQRVFLPLHANESAYRVDYCWERPDNALIVGELDGAQKYWDPAMTKGKSAQEVAHQQTQRERALYERGVSKIIRFTYADVVARKPFIRILNDGGVPRVS